MNGAVARLGSTKGAASYQPGATPQEPHSPGNLGLKARANLRALGRGFQPPQLCATVTQRVAVCWYESGAFPPSEGAAMKKGWQTKQLGELAELKGRIGWRGLTAKEYTKEGPLFLSVHSLSSTR